jgi:NADPH:quinone reductase-like Zn-dependent oxidoreductase
VERKSPFPRVQLFSRAHFIKDLVEKGKFKPVIDRKYPLEKIAESIVYVASGKKIGNVIITMDA